MNRIIKNTVLSLFWTFIFVLLVFNGTSYLDYDFGWHLKVGEKISQIKQAPNIEYFDYTLLGQSWVDHEWGFNYLTYLIFDKFGYFSLVIFYAGIAWLSFFLLYLLILKGNKKNFDENFLFKILLLLFILLGVYASLPHLGVRLQEITILNVVLLLTILNSYTKNKNFKTLIFLPLIFLFWANMHAGFLIGLFLLFMWSVLKFLERLSFQYRRLDFINYKEVINIKYLLIFLGFSFLSFLVTLINPYGINLYGFLSSYANSYYLKNIAEWTPVYYLPIMYKQILYSALALAVFIILIFNRKIIPKKEKIKINIWHFSVFVIFIYLAEKSRRHFPLFFVINLPIIFPFYIEIFKDSFGQLKKIVNLRIVSFFVISVLFLLISGKLNETNFFNDPFEEFCGVLPCSAVDYLNENNSMQNKRVFNDYGWGGYLIWKLPNMKLFIDGRLPQFEYNNHTMLEEYKDFFVEDKIKGKLDEQRIEMVLMKAKNHHVNLNWFEKYFLMYNEEKLNSKSNKLRDYLSNNLQWEEIYSDNVAKIYIKK